MIEEAHCSECCSSVYPEWHGANTAIYCLRSKAGTAIGNMRPANRPVRQMRTGQADGKLLSCSLRGCPFHYAFHSIMNYLFSSGCAGHSFQHRLVIQRHKAHDLRCCSTSSGSFVEYWKNHANIFYTHDDSRDQCRFDGKSAKYRKKEHVS